MRKLFVVWCLTIAIICFPSHVKAASIDFTFTADNWVLFWYQNGNPPILLSGLDSNASNWRVATKVTLDLEIGKTYEIIWQTENVSSPGQSPGAFLAEISSAVSLNTPSLYSSSSWQVALLRGGSRDMIADFSSLTWVSATEYGSNDDSSTIWYQYNNNSPISGISGNANWIWWETNWMDPAAPAAYDAVFIKTTLTPVPEPSTLWLFVLGLVGLTGVRVYKEIFCALSRFRVP